MSYPTTLSSQMETDQSPGDEKNEEQQPIAKITMVEEEVHKMCMFSRTSLVPKRTKRPTSMIFFQVATERSGESGT